MARKFEISPNRHAWNLEGCEELLLIAGYEEISRYIAPGQPWKAMFENHFFEHGNGVSFESLDNINAERRRHGLPKIEIRETDIYDYARSRDKLLKSNQRQRLRDEITSASVDVRQNRVAQAKIEAENLPPPHLYFEEHKTRQAQQCMESHLSREEITKRHLICRQIAVPPKTTQAKVPLDPEMAAKALILSSGDETLQGNIISRLFSCQAALETAERVEDPDLRKALVKHALGCGLN